MGNEKKSEKQETLLRTVVPFGETWYNISKVLPMMVGG